MASRTRGRQRARQHVQPKALHPAMGALSAQTTAAPVSITDLLNRLTSQNSFNSLPMARDPRDRVPFGPLNPLNPSGLDPARPDTGRPGPRLTEYPVATNINFGRPLPWRILREAADNVDILRRCIEVRKADMRSLDWAWVVSDEAVAEAYRNNPARGKSDLAADLREQWMPEIRRLTEFWENPWPSEGLDFGAWVNQVMEDRLVLDAVTLYPQTTYGGDLIAFEIIDSEFIKVLRDFRGARPVAPFPAFQQILYGFPRGEWQATTETDADGNIVINGGFLADQMYYHKENSRSGHVYGYSPVEQALISARLYLKRQGWMLSEYDDGVLPSMIIESSETLSLTPKERRAYETDLNDELTGQTRARHRAKFMFPGTKTTLLPDVAERYKPEYDLFLIKLLASHLGVSATKLGFSETKGLGGSGMHEAQSQAAQDLGVQPDIKMMSGLVMSLSTKWLRAPVEIKFKFLDADGENEQVRAAIVVGEMGTAQRTVNEARTDGGKPVLDIPEADMPYILTPTGPVFLEGASAPKVVPGQPTAAAANAGADQAQADPQTAAPNAATAAEPPAKPVKTKPKKAIVKHAGPDHVSAQAVIDQLAPDYPPESMGWIHGAHWSGPTAVPLSKIDFDDVDSWDASGDPDKVDAFTEKIRAGKMKPVVVVKTPGDDRLKVVDGHHRVLAYQKLKKPVMAWVGKVGAKVGPWTQMHASQHSGSETGTEPTSGAPSSTDKAAPVDEPRPATIVPMSPAKVAEIRQYRRFVAKGARGREFAWVHHDANEIATITKAGDASDPKAEAAQPPPVEPDIRWPAWAVDTLLAMFWAEKIRQALTRGLDILGIARAWARDTAGWQTSDAVPDALSWLRASGVDTDTLTEHLAPVLHDAATVGYSVGTQSAAAALKGDAKVGVNVDWSAFKPGNVAAARKVLSEDGMDVGLTDLLDAYGVTIRGVAAHRLDEVAAVLADGLERGEAPQTIGRALRGVVDDPNWALTVAWTETNRAQSAAALDRYRAAGKEGKAWFTARDQSVCVICATNEDQGGIPLDDPFVSGDQSPPGHPRCRCGLLPSKIDAAPVSDEEPPSTVEPESDATVEPAEPTLADHVASGVESTQQLGGGYAARTDLVTFADGTQAVRKTVLNGDVRDPVETQDAEELASLYARALGINAPEVLRTAPDSLFMDFVTDGITAAERFDVVSNNTDVDALADTEAGRRIGLFDLAIGNVDRNSGNWIVSDDDVLTAIDHGYGFVSPGKHAAQVMELVTGPNNVFAHRLLSLPVAYEAGGTRAFSHADVAHLLEVLEALKPEFKRTGRMRWYGDTKRRLALIDEYAQDDGGLF